MTLASSLMKDLDDKTVKDGESWARNRQAFWSCSASTETPRTCCPPTSPARRSTATTRATRTPATPSSRSRAPSSARPSTPSSRASSATNRSSSLPRPFVASAWRSGRTGAARGAGRSTSRCSNGSSPFQRIALSHCFSPDVLARLENQELQVDPASKPLKISELFSALTDGIWKELTAPPADADKPALEISTIRRNLQREHLRHLSGLVLASSSRGYADQFVYVDFGNTSVPADARALARLHLKTIRDRITSALDRPGVSIDDTTRAHLEETRDRITKVLDASLQAESLPPLRFSPSSP